MIEIYYMNNEKKIIKDNEEVFIDKNDFNLDEESFKILREFESSKIFNGYSVNQLYYYDDIEMYTFYRPGVYSKIKKVVAFINYLMEIEKTYNDKIKIYTDDYYIKKISDKLFSVKCELVQIKEKKESNSKIKLLRRAFIGIKNLLKYRMKSKTDENGFLIISHATSIVSSKEGLYDYEYGLVMNGIMEKYNVLNLQYLNSSNAYKNSIKFNTPLFPLEMFILYKKFKWKKLYDDNKVINRINLINNAVFKYKGLNILELILGSENVMKLTCDSYIKEYLCAMRFLEKNKFRKLITVDEGDRARCFIIAGNKLGIDTYAIQHGLFNYYSPTYMLIDNNKFMVPKKTFVWGEYYKEVLVNSTAVYSNNNVVAVGQPRSDIIKDKASENLKKNDKIKVLYATQYLEDLTKLATELIFNAFSKLNLEYELVVKLHPIDPFEDFYYECKEKYKLDNVVITRDRDLYEILNWCDLVLSVHSTVVLEGAMLNKPSICVLLEDYNDIGNYVKDGISLGVNSSEELVKVLQDKLYINNKNIDKIIQSYFHKVDGKVNERILKEIQS
ncbi:MAG: hypothetical protein GX275_07500 [Clostridiales bacterium]|nr:hypothetical protein [Clostridiales bacterium]